MKILTFFLVLYIFICVSRADAAVCMKGRYSHYFNDPAIATGIVQATGRNTIDIYDEEQRKVERFIYFVHGEGFHKGDYVRVYYHPISGIVQIIKKMTILKYKMNGQNLGYICR